MILPGARSTDKNTSLPIREGQGRLERAVTNDHNTLESSLSALMPSDSTFQNGVDKLG